MRLKRPLIKLRPERFEYGSLLRDFRLSLIKLVPLTGTVLGPDVSKNAIRERLIALAVNVLESKNRFNSIRFDPSPSVTVHDVMNAGENLLFCEDRFEKMWQAIGAFHSLIEDAKSHIFHLAEQRLASGR
jgi:hypothetical protein